MYCSQINLFESDTRGEYRNENRKLKGHAIRFVEKEPGDWWAVLADVCNALDLGDPTVIASKINSDEQAMFNFRHQGEIAIISELGVYETFFLSRKKEAIEFQGWTREMAGIMLERGKCED